MSGQTSNGGVGLSPPRSNQRTLMNDFMVTFSSPVAWVLVVALVITWSGVAIVVFDLLDYKTLAGNEQNPWSHHAHPFYNGLTFIEMCKYSNSHSTHVCTSLHCETSLQYCVYESYYAINSLSCPSLFTMTYFHPQLIIWICVDYPTGIFEATSLQKWTRS